MRRQRRYRRNVQPSGVHGQSPNRQINSLGRPDLCREGMTRNRAVKHRLSTIRSGGLRNTTPSGNPQGACSCVHARQTVPTGGAEAETRRYCRGFLMHSNIRVFAMALVCLSLSACDKPEVKACEAFIKFKVQPSSYRRIKIWFRTTHRSAARSFIRMPGCLIQRTMSLRLSDAMQSFLAMLSGDAMCTLNMRRTALRQRSDAFFKW